MKKITVYLIALALIATMVLMGVACKTTTTETTTAETTAATTISETTVAETTVAEETTATKSFVVPWLIPMQDVYWEYCTFAMNKLAAKVLEERGWDIKIEQMATVTAYDVNEQLGQMENAITQKVDGIIVCPTNELGVIPAVEKAKEAGIPVVALSAMIPTEALLTDARCDEFLTNVSYTEFVIKEEGKENGFNALILSGLTGNITSDERTRGYEAGIGAFPNGKILDIQLAEFNREKGMSVTENLLSKYPEVDFIFCINDNEALGAYEAVLAAGRQDEIVVVGHDGIPDGLNSLLQGKIKYDCFLSPFQMGEDALASLIDYWDGKDVPNHKYFIGEPVTKDNAQKFLDLFAEFEAAQK